jgi:hypothetical protein
MGSDWNRGGLRFECTQCGNCCTGTAGSVLVDDDELAELARQQELSIDEFRQVYTRPTPDGRVSLREKSNGECIFYTRGNGCGVYTHRPRQCRSWPFWRAVVEGEDRWAEAAVHCPGMNRGPLHSVSEIRETSRRDGTRGTLPDSQ